MGRPFGRWHDLILVAHREKRLMGVWRGAHGECDDWYHPMSAIIDARTQPILPVLTIIPADAGIAALLAGILLGHISNVLAVIPKG